MSRATGPRGRSTPRPGRRPGALPVGADRRKLGPFSLSPLVVAEVTSPTVVVEAFDRGFNTFLVTADLGWPRFEPLRRGLSDLLARRGVRDQLVVLGVSSAAHPAHSRSAFGELLEAVPALDHLDLLGIAGVGSGDAVPRVAALAELRRHRSFGCRAIAASFDDSSVASWFIEHALVDLAILELGAHLPDSRALLDRLAPARRRPLVLGRDVAKGFVSPEKLDALGVDPLNWRPTAHDHYRAALSHPGLDGLVLPRLSARDLDAIEAALAKGSLDPESQAYLERTTRLNGRSPAAGYSTRTLPD